MTKQLNKEIRDFLKQKGIDSFLLLVENKDRTHDLLRRYYPNSYIEVLGDSIKRDSSTQPI